MRRGIGLSSKRLRVGQGTALCLCVLLLGIALAPGAAAQSRGKIAGTVTDAATGESLPGVNVVVVGTQLGTATDLDGDYFIANLQVGTYDVRATYIGYDTLTVAGVTVGPDATAAVDFAMQEATLNLEGEITVTAERPLVERDNTTSVTRLRAEEVAYKPTTELTQVLTTLPSINVEDGEITVRGRTLDEVAFMVDGARSRNPLNHDAYTRINISAIQELEVITGSFNAEYGEAQSGVINVITKEGSSDAYEFYLDTRFSPPGKRHFGAAFYDRSNPDYWENTNAMHLDWWIENTDQWVDRNGVLGSDPRSAWTPEEAYEQYLSTHQPLTDYTDTPTYQVEVGLGGPIPALSGLTFYGTMKYRSQAPLYGNAYRERGEFIDGNLKVALPLGGGKKLVVSGFYGQEETGWGFSNDPFWALTFGANGRYAHYDFPGLPYSQTNGQSLQFAHALNASTLYEIRFARTQAIREVSPFPDDPLGFEASGPTESIVRADEIAGDNANPVGFNTTGYFFRYNDNNTEWAFEGAISSQFNKYLAAKAGAEFSYYVLDHFNEAKLPARFDDRTYNPYQGAAYAQSKAEYGSLIVNAGLRLDFYNANDTLYTNPFAPFEDDASKESTALYAQISPRIGVAHPIDDRTVLHFSYGHFFQRPPFNDYGEGSSDVLGSLNTFIVEETGLPWVLANRNLRPQKTIAFEVGIERNFWDFFILDVTGYYKDIRNTIRTITVQTADGGSYATNGNGDYADVRGVELSLRKVPSTYGWGTVSGYANFTTQIGIFGRSGDPIAVEPDPNDPDGVRYRFGPSGDFIEHNNPRLKLGLYYQTPTDWQGTLAALGGISLSLDYRASFPNDELREDFFLFEDQKYVRPVDQVTDLRLRKEIALPRGLGRLSPYLEVQNLFNDRWIFFPAVEGASQADQRAFVESGFEDLPSRTAEGIPIIDVAQFRNLRRSVIFGLTLTY